MARYVQVRLRDVANRDEFAHEDSPQDALNKRLEALLNTSSPQEAEDEHKDRLWDLSGIDYDKPVPSLHDLSARLEAGGERSGSANYCNYYQTTKRRTYACSDTRARQIMSKMAIDETLRFEQGTVELCLDEMSPYEAVNPSKYRQPDERLKIERIRLGRGIYREGDPTVPHFEYGIAYPPQEPLVDRSITTGHRHRRREDRVYHETMNHPKIYPQIGLCDEDELVEEVRPARNPSDDGDKHVDRAAPAFEVPSTTKEMQSMWKLLWSLMDGRSKDTGEVLVENAYHSRKANAEDTLGLGMDDIVGLFLSAVDSTQRCNVCSAIDFNLTVTDGKDEEGRSVRLVNRPTIVYRDGYERLHLLPSFNEMVRNCQGSTCSQCSLILRVLILNISRGVFGDKLPFDRNARVRCYLSTPIGTLEQYHTLLSQELLRSSPRPLPAPVLRIKPPYQGRQYGDIPLWIENTSLPLPYMPGSGKFIKSDGVDLARVRNWWTKCQGTHGHGCQVASKHRYAGKDAAGYVLRLVDVQLNRVVVAPQGCNYVALSYVWPRTENPFRAQEKHFRRLRTSRDGLPIRDDEAAYFDIPVKQLPKTIRDALRIADNIGERYLWIDALCIIQDDAVDVQRTVYKMDQIYGAASLTIVMGDREGAVLEGGRPHSYQPSQRVGDTTYMIPFVSLSASLRQSIWQSRGWTYQEWQFSTCKLVFVDSLAYYTCSRSSFQEDQVDSIFGPNVDGTTNSDKFFPDQNAYCRHVEAYSSRNLTNGSDILDAFSGIMNLMKPRLHTDFCWGLPLGAFDGALLWHSVDALVRRTDMKAPRLDAKSVAFPSWSWAGWKGAVRFRSDYHSDRRAQRTLFDGAVNRLGHITTLITWPWQMGFDLPPNGPDLKTIISDILLRGVLRFVTNVARVNVGRLRHLFAQQEIDGWTLDDGTTVTRGCHTCIVLSEVENPQIGGRQPGPGEITGPSPITTYHTMVVKEKAGGVLERIGIAKVTRKIWEACDPEIRWVTLS